MIPNNNLSVLPWYTSIDQQNARKWWVYGRVFPLFTPAGYILPFQVIREHREMWVPDGEEIVPERGGSGAIAQNGGIDTTPPYADDDFGEYDVGGEDVIYIEDMPQPFDGMLAGAGFTTPDFDELTGRFSPEFDADHFYDGIWELPADSPYGLTGTIRLITSSAAWGGSTKVYSAKKITRPVSSFAIYTKDGELVQTFNPDDIGIQIVGLTTSDSDVIVFPGQVPITPSMNNGQYYAVMSDGIETWYSEVFTVVNDIAPYLKIEWWDNENFVMDAGTIIYQSPSFRNVLYLNAEIAKPEYLFEEEGETRDGYFFPVKMISEKRYRFKFFAAEYLLDVMRFIRMADFAQITANGQVYSLDTFLITPEWEENGDVASVEAQFDTATVAKKIGVGYIKAQRGDFNDDFNNDYNI